MIMMFYTCRAVVINVIMEEEEHVILELEAEEEHIIILEVE